MEYLVQYCYPLLAYLVLNQFRKSVNHIQSIFNIIKQI